MEDELILSRRRFLGVSAGAAVVLAVSASQGQRQSAGARPVPLPANGAYAFDDEFTGPVARPRTRRSGPTSWAAAGGATTSCRSTPARRLTPAPTAGATWSSPRSPGATGPGPAPGSRPRACSPRSAGPGRPGSSWIRSRDSGRRSGCSARTSARWAGRPAGRSTSWRTSAPPTCRPPCTPRQAGDHQHGLRRRGLRPRLARLPARLDGRRAGVLPRRGALPDRHRGGLPGRVVAVRAGQQWRLLRAAQPGGRRRRSRRCSAAVGADPVRMLVDYVRVWA